MSYCGNLANFITGTIQTIGSPQALPPIALRTEPHNTMKMIMTDVVLTPVQEDTLVTITIPETMIASPLIVTAKSKIITLMIASKTTILLL